MGACYWHGVGGFAGLCFIRHQHFWGVLDIQGRRSFLYRRGFISRGIYIKQNKPWLADPDPKPTPAWLGGAMRRSRAKTKKTYYSGSTSDRRNLPRAAVFLGNFLVVIAASRRARQRPSPLRGGHGEGLFYTDTKTTQKKSLHMRLPLTILPPREEACRQLQLFTYRDHHKRSCLNQSTAPTVGVR